MSRELIKIIAVDGSRCREVPGNATVRGNICRGSGTGTTYNGTGTHMQYTIGTGTKQTGTGTPKQQITSSLLVPVPTCNFCEI